MLCEGDRTFRAFDLEKLLAYAPHADIVNGTRIVERLRQHTTQLSTFMYYGNLFVGKLLEAKHLGRSTLTDRGHHLQAVPSRGADDVAAAASTRRSIWNSTRISSTSRWPMRSS